MKFSILTGRQSHSFLNCYRNMYQQNKLVKVSMDRASAFRITRIVPEVYLNTIITNTGKSLQQNQAINH